MTHDRFVVPYRLSPRSDDIHFIAGFPKLDWVASTVWIVADK